MHVLAVTPIKPGTILAPFDLGIERFVSEMSPFGETREASINMNRQRLQSMVRRVYAMRQISHILLLDSDVVATKEIFELLKKAWKPGYTACANTKGGATTHVLASFALIGVNDYLNIDYLTNINQCQCQKVPNPFYVEGAATTEIR